MKTSCKFTFDLADAFIIVMLLGYTIRCLTSTCQFSVSIPTKASLYGTWKEGFLSCLLFLLLISQLLVNTFNVKAILDVKASRLTTR